MIAPPRSHFRAIAADGAVDCSSWMSGAGALHGFSAPRSPLPTLPSHRPPWGCWDLVRGRHERKAHGGGARADGSVCAFRAGEPEADRCRQCPVDVRWILGFRKERCEDGRRNRTSDEVIKHKPPVPCVFRGSPVHPFKMIPSPIQQKHQELFGFLGTKWPKDAKNS